MEEVENLGLVRLDEGKVEEFAGELIVFQVEANPKPPKKHIYCGFGSKMDYENFDHTFVWDGVRFSFPNIPGFVCNCAECKRELKLILEEVSNEIDQKFTEALEEIQKLRELMKGRNKAITDQNQENMHRIFEDEHKKETTRAWKAIFDGMKNSEEETDGK